MKHTLPNPCTHKAASQYIAMCNYASIASLLLESYTDCGRSKVRNMQYEIPISTDNTVRIRVPTYMSISFMYSWDKGCRPAVFAATPEYHTQTCEQPCLIYSTMFLETFIIWYDNHIHPYREYI